MVHLLFAVIVGGVAWGVWMWRRWWVSHNPPPFVFPQKPETDIPRLLVHFAIIVFVVGLSTLGSVLSLAGFCKGQRLDAPLFSKNLKNLVDGVTALVVAAITVGSALLVQGLRDWLHIVLDVINHFYRRWEPLTPSTQIDILEFEIQQLIERRFREVLWMLLREDDVTHLSVGPTARGR